MEKREKAKHNMLRPSYQWFHPSNIKVYMYMDEPGVYRDVHENLLPEALAEGAGAPVAKIRKLAKVKGDQDIVAANMAAALSSEERYVVEKRAHYTLVSIADGLFHIENNEDGSRFTPQAMGEGVARITFDQIDPPVKKEEAAAEAAEEPVLFGGARAAA